MYYCVYAVLGSKARCCSREMFGQCSIHRNGKSQSNYSFPRKSERNETVVRKFINDKRLKRFETSSSSSLVTMAFEDDLSVAKNRRNLPEKSKPEEIKIKEGNPKFSPDQSNAVPKASQQSLTLYKIPKKNSTSAAPNNIPDVKPQIKESLHFKPTSKSKSPVKPTKSGTGRKKLKLPDVPEESLGILHLLPPDTARTPAKKTWVDDKPKILDSGPTAQNTDNTKTAQRSWSESYSTLSNILNPDDRNISGYTNNRIKLFSSKKEEEHEGGDKETLRNSLMSSSTPVSASIRRINNGSSSQKIKQNSLSRHGKDSNQYLGTSTATNIVKPCSSARQTADAQSSRPVAVVHPTQVTEKDIEGGSHETEAAKRRMEVQHLMCVKRKPRNDFENSDTDNGIYMYHHSILLPSRGNVTILSFASCY